MLPGTSKYLCYFEKSWAYIFYEYILYVYVSISIYYHEYKSYLYMYTYKHTHFYLPMFSREAKQTIVMCLKNSSTQIIIHCFAWKYYFIDYKTFSSRNALEDQVRKGNALFQIISVTEEKCASFKKIDNLREINSFLLKIDIKC